MQNIVVSTMVAETHYSNIYNPLSKNATSLQKSVLEIFVYMGKIRMLQK